MAAVAAAARNTKMQHGENGIMAVHKMSQNRQLHFLTLIWIWLCGYVRSATNRLSAHMYGLLGHVVAS